MNIRNSWSLFQWAWGHFWQFLTVSRLRFLLGSFQPVLVKVRWCAHSQLLSSLASIMCNDGSFLLWEASRPSFAGLLDTLQNPIFTSVNCHFYLYSPVCSYYLLQKSIFRWELVKKKVTQSNWLQAILFWSLYFISSISNLSKTKIHLQAFYALMIIASATLHLLPPKDS